MNYYDNKQSFRSDMAGIIRRHVPLAEMNSARLSENTGKPLRTNIATEIRRNTRNGDQTNRRGIRTESKIDGLRAEVEQLTKIVQQLGEKVGADPTSLKIDTVAVDRVIVESAQKLLEEINQEAADTERFLASVAEPEEDPDEEA